MKEERENLLPETTGQENTEVAVRAGYGTVGGFELMQRQAKALSASQLIPKQFQGKVADCLIALEMAQRIGASPFAVLQNLYIVHGKPSWSSQFLISCINACGRFSPLRYREIGKRGDDSWGVVAWAKDLNDGEVLESPEVTLAIAKAEGWYGKEGSKWKTIPELMLRYRAATFFARTYAPDVSMGVVTREEAHDVSAGDIEISDSPFEDEPEAKPDHAADADAAPPEAEDPNGPGPGGEGGNARPDLTPVEELAKPACKAGIRSYASHAFFPEIVNDSVPPDMSWEQAPVSVLREILKELRARDEQQQQ